MVANNAPTIAALFSVHGYALQMAGDALYAPQQWSTPGGPPVQLTTNGFRSPLKQRRRLSPASWPCRTSTA